MVDDMLRDRRARRHQRRSGRRRRVACAIQRLVAAGTISRADTVVLFNTGGALKYLDVLH